MKARTIHLTHGDVVRVREDADDCFSGEEGVVSHILHGYVYVTFWGQTISHAFPPETLEWKEVEVRWHPVLTTERQQGIV